MIKVVHLSTFHLSGGAGVAAARLNRALNKSGVDSVLLTGKSSGTEEKVVGLDGDFLGKAGFWMRFTTERLFFLGFEKSSRVRYAFSPAVTGKDLTGNRLVREADIIHLHWINFGRLSIRNLRQLFELRKPVVWTLHDMWAFTGGCHHSGDCDHYQRSCGDCKFLKKPGPHDLSYRRLAKKKRLWHPESEFVVAGCSQWLADRARKSSLMQPFEVRSIPNPIDTALFRPREKSLSRASLGLPGDKDYLLFAAAKISAEGKGFLFLKKALQILVENNPEAGKTVELLVIGGGDADEIGDIPLKAHYLGYIGNEETIVQVYSAASLYVTPSLEDNLPNTIMEALACGTPVVGFRTGGIPEMIDHKENGYVADYRSPGSLAEGIGWVLENNAGGRLSEAARAKVMNEYAEEVVTGKYVSLYQDILRR